MSKKSKRNQPKGVTLKEASCFSFKAGLKILLLSLILQFLVLSSPFSLFLVTFLLSLILQFL